MIKLPHRLEPWNVTGWTVREMTPREAADFVTRYPSAAMPCWRRFDIVDGALTLVR